VKNGEIILVLKMKGEKKIYQVIVYREEK